MSTRRISEVLKCTSPISPDQVTHRAFVSRGDYRDELVEAIGRDGVLIVSGYSGIGKTSLLNLATSRRALSARGLVFTSIVAITADEANEGGLIETIYNEIFRFTSGTRLEAVTPSAVAGIIHQNQLLLIIDGVNAIFDDAASSRSLLSLCKAWSDLPKGVRTQSKLVLVAAGESGQVAEWLQRTIRGKRLPREHIVIPPWTQDDLVQILAAASRSLKITFDKELQAWLARIACGLPATMTLLAALATRKANYERDTIVASADLRVGLRDLQGVFGESAKFRDILCYDNSIECADTPLLFALYVIGLSGGALPEDELYSWLDDNALELGDTTDIGALITVHEHEGRRLWSVRELSYSTFAFLKLYFLARVATPSARRVELMLNSLHDTADGVRWQLRDNIGSESEGLNASGASILFLAADPTDATRLRLGQELREIQERIQLGRRRDEFTLSPRMSVRPADVCQALLDVQPQIVHFSGHGTSEGAICLEGVNGHVHPVDPDALAALFEQFSDQVRCVVLNACFSEAQARAIARHIGWVVGMSDAIEDRTAIAFSIGFYQALCAGRDVVQAYKLGCVQIRIQNAGGASTPILIKGGTAQAT